LATRSEERFGMFFGRARRQADSVATCPSEEVKKMLSDEQLKYRGFNKFYGHLGQGLDADEAALLLHQHGWYMKKASRGTVYFCNDERKMNYFNHSGYVTWEEGRQAMVRAGIRPGHYTVSPDDVTIEGATVTIKPGAKLVPSGLTQVIGKDESMASKAEVQRKLKRAERMAMEAEEELARIEARESAWDRIFNAGDGTIIRFWRNFGGWRMYTYGAIKVEGSWFLTGPRQVGKSWSSNDLIDEWLEPSIIEGFKVEMADTYKQLAEGGPF
jgi:hypothetical protein